jgi:type IV pilus assembly protein PilA
MSKLIRKSNKGFTLIELMIVVAIIGILAAIAIPNFLRFQLKSKSSEGKVNLAAIRTAEASYLAEFGVYVPAGVAPNAGIPGSSKAIFAELANPGGDFNTLGWTPEGQVFFQYGVSVNANPGLAFTATATADIDGDGVITQQWAYVKSIPNSVPAAGDASGLNALCLGSGVWDAAANAASAVDTVGPCDVNSGQSNF